jgi:streptogramin lyase
MLYETHKSISGMRTLSSLIKLTATGADTLIWRETPLRDLGDIRQIIPDEEGNIWLTTHLENKLGQISADGSITVHSLPNRFSTGTIGPDGDLWLIGEHVIARWVPGVGLTDLEDELYQLPRFIQPTQVDMDTAGRMWTASSFSGSYSFRYLYRYEAGQGITMEPLLESGLWGLLLENLEVDEQGRLYMNYVRGYMTRYDPEAKKWEVLQNRYHTVPSGWKWGHMRRWKDTLYMAADFHAMDRITSLEGMWAYHPATDTWKFDQQLQQASSYGLNGESIKDISLSPEGEVTFTIGNGRNIFTRRDNQWQNISPHSSSGEAPSREPTRLNKIEWDLAGNLWGVDRQLKQVWTYQGQTWDSVALDLPHRIDWQDIHVDQLGRKWLIGRQHVLILDDSYLAGLGTPQLLLNATALGLQGMIEFSQLGPNGYLWLFTDDLHVIRYSCEGTVSYALPAGELGPSRFFSDMAISPAGKVFIAEYRRLFQLNLPALPTATPCMTERVIAAERGMFAPNPARQTIRYNHGNPNEGRIDITWHDLSGRKVRHETLNYVHPGIQISLAGLAAGIYAVVVRTESDLQHHKVLVE